MINKVVTLKAKITFVKAVEKCGCEWYQKVIERLQHEPDLVVADVSYYNFCQAKLYHNITGREKRDVDSQNPLTKLWKLYLLI